MISDNCLVGCRETHHHRNCNEYMQLNNHVETKFLETKEVIARRGYANLITPMNIYIVLETYKQQYMIQCDNGKIHKLSKKLFYGKI